MFYLHLVVFFITSLDKGVKMLVLKPCLCHSKGETGAVCNSPLGFWGRFGFFIRYQSSLMGSEVCLGEWDRGGTL